MAGPAGAPWSPTVNGLRGRLQVVVKQVEKGTPVITTYLYLKTDPSRMATTTVAIDEAKLVFTVTDSAGEVLPPTNGPYEETRAPYGVLRLPHDSELHFNIAHHGAGVPGDQAGMLDLGSGAAWVLPRKTGEKYFLRGKLTIAGPQDGWTGTLELPAVPVPPPPDRSAWSPFRYQFKPANAEKIRKAIHDRYDNAKGITIMVRGIGGRHTVEGRGEPDKVKELLELLKELDK
jgi:hypothetical protein